jgi:protein SCO1/2
MQFTHTALIQEVIMRTNTAFSPIRRRLLQHGLWASSSLFLVGRTGAAASMDMAVQDHAHHAMPSEQDRYVRSMENYAIPDVNMVDADGVGLSLRSALADKPVFLNFIFTSCGAVCPVMSRIFLQVQSELGPERDKVRMVSISIDPEQDTPAVLKAYADKYGAGPQWKMLTGSLNDSISVQRAFNVYRSDKMDHLPTTFLHARPGQPWVRLDGFASAADILHEYHQLTSN